jgi:hypothetical protein
MVGLETNETIEDFLDPVHWYPSNFSFNSPLILRISLEMNDRLLQLQKLNEFPEESWVDERRCVAHEGVGVHENRAQTRTFLAEELTWSLVCVYVCWLLSS